MDFNYIVSTTSGAIKRGVVAAATKEDALSWLRHRSWSVISVNLITKKLSSSLAIGGTLFLGRVTALDKIIFVRHMAIMLRSGLSLVESLKIIEDQTPSKQMKRIMQRVIHQVTNGMGLADSLAQHKKYFSGVIIGMVKVGEASGTLEENLEYIGTELEKSYELRRKIRSAMIYPGIVLSATFILGIALSVFILPRLVQMFSTFRIELPTITKVFLNIASFLVSYGWALLGLMAVLIVVVRILAVAAVSKPFFHRLYLHVPLFKKMIKNAHIARVTRTMSLLLKSGVTINEALAITADVVDNVVYKDELVRAQIGVQKGQTLATMLSNEEFVPKMANRMIGVGERTGKLDESLAYLASFYEDEVDNATRNLSSVLEPVLLLIIGVVLGFLAVAIISPIYQFTGSLQP